jgi:radical SAM protein with 4Fe4S-binding SPASM domain
MTSTGRFLSVYMDQNNKCNLRCKTCGFSDPRVEAVPKYDMPRGLYDLIAEQLFPLTNYLALSLLSEPFMTNDFPDRLWLTRDSQVPFTDIITNGTLLTRSSIGRMLDAQISRVTVSIDGGTREVFESLRPGASFSRVVENVELLLSLRCDRESSTPRLRIHHVLSTANVDQFDNFLVLIERLVPEEIDVRTMHRMSPQSVIQPSDDAAFFEKVGTIRRRLAAFCRRTGIEDAGFLRHRHGPVDLFTPDGERMTCRRPWDTVAIYPNGDVQPCMAWTRPPIGNLAEQSFEEIWNGNDLAALRREFESVGPGVDCQHCVINKRPETGNDDYFFEKINRPPPTWPSSTKPHLAPEALARPSQ